MNIKMKMKIISVSIVKTVSPKVKARADVEFDGFVLKGFKVIQDESTRKDYVTPPSYLSPKGWRPLFKTTNPDDWQEISRRIVQEYDLFLMKEATNQLTEKDVD